MLGPSTPDGNRPLSCDDPWRTHALGVAVPRGAAVAFWRNRDTTSQEAGADTGAPRAWTLHEGNWWSNVDGTWYGRDELTNSWVPVEGAAS